MICTLDYLRLDQTVVPEFTVTKFTPWTFLNEIIYLCTFSWHEFQANWYGDDCYNRDFWSGVVLAFFIQRKDIGMVKNSTSKMLRLYFSRQIWLYIGTYQI